MKNIILILVALFSVATFSTSAKADGSRGTATAGFGKHLNNEGRQVVGYYCPVGYRLVYGPYVVYQTIWNGYQWVYVPVTAYGYYCVWP